MPFAMLWLALACAHAYDPVAGDPPPRDPPPALVPIRIPSHGEALNAIVYTPGGPGPHPTALFLHGLPGNERNLDLAQAARRAGWNAVFFHYRGAWGSGGRYSFGGVLEDVVSAVAWARDPAPGAGLDLDPERIALVGHSLGGFAALGAGADLEAVGCIASIAGANLAAPGRAAHDDPGFASGLAARFEGLTAPLHGTSGAALAAELGASFREFDVLGRAAELAAKPLLLVAGARDEVTPPAQAHAPLVAALATLDPIALEAHILDTDHSFSGVRVALARLLVDWLNGPCAEGFPD